MGTTLESLLANCVGTIILGVSNYLQQLCTSPTENDIYLELAECGDINFGANSPWRLFRLTKHRSSLCSAWIVLMVTSVPIHLFLNGMFGYARTILPWKGATILSKMTSEFIVGDELSWANVTNEMCVQFLSETYNTKVRNFTAVINTTSVDTTQLAFIPIPPNWNLTTSLSDIHDPGTVVLDLWNTTNNAPPFLYCLVDYVEPQCGISVRWAPSVVISITLVIKSVFVLLILKRILHFRSRLYNSLGDIIDLAVRHPEFLEPPTPDPRSTHSYTIVYRETKAVCKRQRLVGIFGATDSVIYIFWVAGVVPLLYLFINTIIIGTGCGLTI